jgi:uncharacterized protein YbbC (DUF1343 family)
MEDKRVRCGLDVFLEKNLSFLEGKKVGIITNQTGIASTGEHIVDALSARPEIEIAALYAPEHGIRGDLPDAMEMASYTDERTGIRVWSLYGQHLKPTDEMLENVDVLVYDIQDVGVRFYTFISTMGLAMEAAAEAGIQFVVFDRPDPINGITVEGPVIEKPFFSFVGRYPVPVRYGLTPGELALMIKGEGWMEGMGGLELRVISMEGWRRAMWFDQTGLPWIQPSPNIPSLLTEALYPGICLVEALNVSEGRGTIRPFKQIGAPWIDGFELAEAMNKLELPGIYFMPVTFTPVSLPGVAIRNKYMNQEIQGLELLVTDRDELRSLQVMVYLLSTLKKLYPEELELTEYLEALIGIQSFRQSIKDLRPPEQILREWEPGIKEFEKVRNKYLLYR